MSDPDRIHPEDISYLRHLLKRHGSILVREAIDRVEKDLEAEYRENARRRQDLEDERAKLANLPRSTSEVNAKVVGGRLAEIDHELEQLR